MRRCSSLHYIPAFLFSLKTTHNTLIHQFCKALSNWKKKDLSKTVSLLVHSTHPMPACAIQFHCQLRFWLSSCYHIYMLEKKVAWLHAWNFWTSYSHDTDPLIIDKTMDQISSLRCLCACSRHWVLEIIILYWYCIWNNKSRQLNWIVHQ